MNLFDFDECSQDIQAMVEQSQDHSATDSFIKQHSVDSIKDQSSQIVLESEKKSIYTVVEESTISNKTEKEEIRIKLEDYERIKSIKKKEILTQTE